MIRLVLRIELLLRHFEHFAVEDLPNTLCVPP